MSSDYDDLFDRFHEIATKKAGTRYEVLTAMVCKTLVENSVVIHDVKLRGDSNVKHQIDVEVEIDGGKCRRLIECKDYDKTIGLGIIRDFESASRDIGADEAWIVTCVGFTSGAIKFAKAKNIKPVIIRLFEDRDMEGRIERVVVNLHVREPQQPVARIFITDANMPALENAKKIAGIGDEMTTDDDAFFEMPDGNTRHFNDVVTETLIEATDLQAEGLARCIFKPQGRKLIIGGIEVPYLGIIVDFQIVTETEAHEYMSTRIAELLVNGIGDKDVVIFDDQIERCNIDENTGEIF